MSLEYMDLTQGVIYRPKHDIAGVRPYFVLPNVEMCEYFDNYGGAPEAALIDWASQFLKPQSSFVDIGAHTGTWSMILGLSSGLPVRAFEAQPWLAAMTNAGFALNEMSNCNCSQGALSDTDGPVTMFIPRKTNQSTLTAVGFDSDGESVDLETGGASIIDKIARLEAGMIELKLQSRTLDSYMTFPSLIKIDVEGAELEVLRGAIRTIKDCKPTIIFECWDVEYGQRTEEIFKYLHDKLDYKTQKVGNWLETWIAEPNV